LTAQSFAKRLIGLRTSFATIRPHSHDLLGGLVTAGQSQPVLLEAKKILANMRARGIACLARAVCGMRLARFDFHAKRRRHTSASLSQFDAEAGDDSASQPLRVALARGPAELEDMIGNRFAEMVGILRAVQQGENRVKRVAQEFGAVDWGGSP
jgi:hypothetical protein